MKVPNYGAVYKMQGLILILLTPCLSKLIFQGKARELRPSPGLRRSLPREDTSTQASLLQSLLDGPLLVPALRWQHDHRAHTLGHSSQEITTSRQRLLTCLQFLGAELKPSSKDLAFQPSACFW